MKGIASTLATIWRLASPYFYSEDRWAGRILLAAVIATELSIVAINVMLNQWNNRFYNALQDRNWDTFVSELLFFCILAGAYILLAVYQLYLNQWLQIRWRQWMTKAYLGKWLDGANHYRMQLLGDAADNPDQRVAEDIQMFIDRTLTIGIGLLSAMVTLGSFVIILWTLSVAAPLHLFGSEWNIPGYLVWAALIYALIGTYLTHLIGWPLVGLNFNQQRFEADFRFNLVRVRENSEQIALLKGEPAETDRLVQRFNHVVANWLLIMTRTKKLSFFTNAYSQISIVFPYVVVSPAYFAGKMQLGGLMQTASAFNSVQTALSFFINVYRSLAEWRSVIQRLDGFSLAVAGGTGGGPYTAGDRRRRDRGWSRGRTQQRRGEPAERSAARGNRQRQDAPRRAGAAYRAVRLGQIDAVPGDRGHLAVRLRPHRGAEGRAADDAAAAAVFPSRAVGRGGELSGGARRL